MKRQIATILWTFIALLQLTHNCLGGDVVQTFEYGYSGELDDIQWLGPSKRTILFRTSDGNVHRSLDSGRNFEKLNSKLASLMTPNVPKDIEIKNIIVHDKNPNSVYLISKGTISYYSENGGSDFTAFRTPSVVEEVLLHPRLPRQVLVGGFSKACQVVKADKWSNENDLDDGKDSKGRESCYKTLYHSGDAGQSFTLLKKYVVQFDWYEKLNLDEVKLNFGQEPTAEQANQKLRKELNLPGPVLASAKKSKQGNQRFGFWDSGVDLLLSDNFFKSEKVLVTGGNRFLFTKNFLFVAQVVNNDETEVKLQLSSDGCKSFYTGSLPFKLTQHAYTVLDATEGVVFLHVNHAGDSSSYGHVYVSDSTGMNFTFSLRDNVRDSQGKCDFDKALSIEGVYMANFVSNVEEIETYADQKSFSSTRKKVRAPQSKIRSVISFDRGGEWSLLRAPQTNSFGQPIDCSSATCSLHLHGHTSSHAPMYSAKSAVGIIMGVGNVGTHLSTKAGELSTYLSRDGGMTWSETRKGSYIYEFGDHGGLIVMAKDTEPTNKLLYSWQQGDNWQEIQFTSNRMDVDNIIIEPSSTSRIFHAYGSRPTPGGFDSGLIITVDFGGLHERECQGHGMPRAQASDYEVWSPRDPNAGGFGSRCHLGHQVEYTRRKKDAACFNPVQFEGAQFVKNCECTERDYECDFGYKREVPLGPCVRDLAISNETLSPPKQCPPSGFYSISNGYRLVGGNTCVGGKSLGATTYTCSRGFLGISSSGWFVLFVICCLVSSMCYISNKAQAQAAMRSFGGLGTKDFGGEVESCWDVIKEFVQSRGRSRGSFFKYHSMNHSNGMPDTAMDFDDGDFGDDDDFVEHGADFDFDDDGEEEDDEAELISASTTAGPLPPGPVPVTNVAVPKLTAPPTAAPLDLFGDEDDETGDAV